MRSPRKIVNWNYTWQSSWAGSRTRWTTRLENKALRHPNSIQLTMRLTETRRWQKWLIFRLVMWMASWSLWRRRSIWSRLGTCWCLRDTGGHMRRDRTKSRQRATRIKTWSLRWRSAMSLLRRWAIVTQWLFVLACQQATTALWGDTSSSLRRCPTRSSVKPSMRWCSPINLSMATARMVAANTPQLKYSKVALLSISKSSRFWGVCLITSLNRKWTKPTTTSKTLA